MKRLLLLLLIAPASALATGGLPVPLESILGDTVKAGDGRQIGELEDVLVRMDGSIEEYLIDFDEIDDELNRGVTTFRDDVANYGEPPLYEGESVEGELYGDFLGAPPERVRFMEEEDVVVVDLGDDGVSGLARRSERRFAEREFLRASEIVGLEVHLADAESFGSVEDVLLSADGASIEGYVVDSWDGLDKHRHLLPVDAVRLLRAERENAIREDYGVAAMRSSYTQERVEALPEFDLDDRRDEATDD